MEYQKLLFLILISFTFQFRSHSFIRKLQAESDLPNSEPEITEVETTLPYVFPSHDEVETTLPFVIPGHEAESTVPVASPETGGPTDFSFPDHNQTETQTPEITDTTESQSTNPHAFPGHEDDPVTTIPSVISQQTYDPMNTELSLLVLVGIGNFRMPLRGLVIEQKVVFEIYYKRIFGRMVLSVRMTVTIKVYYRRLRGLQEETEEKDVEAECLRKTYDEDPNIRYNCSFDVDEDREIYFVSMDPKTIKFDGMPESIAPIITISSLANETITEKGLQTATGDELLKTQYLMNNTVLEENGLRFKLTGEMDSYLQEKKIILSFDEKGNGKIKNATCDVNYLQGNIYELDCLAEKGINAHLNGINGITTSSNEKVIIYMKPGTDEVLNSGSNYMGLYNRASSSGLSGGAIAGIVIACVIALLAIAIGAMLCRKANVPAPFQESTLGINTSNMTD